jgi:hypothetical protein
VYEAAAKATPLATPRAPAQGSEEEESLAARLAAGAALLPGSPLPPLGEFLARAAACTPPAVRASLFLGNVCPPLLLLLSRGRLYQVRAARRGLNTLPPFADGPLHAMWAEGSKGANAGLAEYLSTGRGDFAEKYFGLG